MKKPKKTTNKPVSNTVNLPGGEPTREEIAAVARSIWEHEGRPEGRAVEHWLQAEIQLRHQPKPGAAPLATGSSASSSAAAAAAA
jgi:hypothetical protein